MRGPCVTRYCGTYSDASECTVVGGKAARGGPSFRRADAAQVCSNVGFVAVDGPSECSPTNAARQIVSERL